MNYHPEKLAGIPVLGMAGIMVYNAVELASRGQYAGAVAIGITALFPLVLGAGLALPYPDSHKTFRKF